MEITHAQFYLYVLLVQLIVGALFGLIPLILGRKRNKRSLGNYGFLTTLLAGALSPLGAIVAVGIFVWMIMKEPAKPEPVNEAPDNTSNL